MVATSSAHLEIPDQALMTANGKPHHAHAHTSAPLPADVDETPPSESFPPFDTMFSARPRVGKLRDAFQHKAPENIAQYNMCLNALYDFIHEMRLQKQNARPKTNCKLRESNEAEEDPEASDAPLTNDTVMRYRLELHHYCKAVGNVSKPRLRPLQRSTARARAHSES